MQVVEASGRIIQSPKVSLILYLVDVRLLFQLAVTFSKRCGVAFSSFDLCLCLSIIYSYYWQDNRILKLTRICNTSPTNNCLK